MAVAASRGIDMSREAVLARQDAAANLRIMKRISAGRARAHHSAVALLESYVLTRDGEDGAKYFALNGPVLPEETWLGFADWYAARAAEHVRVRAAEQDEAEQQAADEAQDRSIAVTTLTALVTNAWEGMERKTDVKHADKAVCGTQDRASRTVADATS